MGTSAGGGTLRGAVSGVNSAATDFFDLSCLWISLAFRYRLATSILDPRIIVQPANLEMTGTVAENPVVHPSLWNRCVRGLESELSEQQLNTWIRPLQAVEDGVNLKLFAPNRFVVDWLNEHCLGRISEIVCELSTETTPTVVLEVGSSKIRANNGPVHLAAPTTPRVVKPSQVGGRLNTNFTFAGFVEGLTIDQQVCEAPRCAGMSRFEFERIAVLQLGFGEAVRGDQRLCFICDPVGLGGNQCVEKRSNCSLGLGAYEF
jgi:hypothetical protein